MTNDDHIPDDVNKELWKTMDEAMKEASDKIRSDIADQMTRYFKGEIELEEMDNHKLSIILGAFVDIMITEVAKLRVSQEFTLKHLAAAAGEEE